MDVWWLITFSLKARNSVGTKQCRHPYAYLFVWLVDARCQFSEHLVGRDPGRNREPQLDFYGLTHHRRQAGSRQEGSIKRVCGVGTVAGRALGGVPTASTIENAQVTYFRNKNERIDAQASSRGTSV